MSDAVVIPPGGTRGDSLQQAGPLRNVGGQRSGHNIYLLDGAKVTDADDLVVAIRAKSVGDRVSMKVRRGNETISLTLTLAGKSGG